MACKSCSKEPVGRINVGRFISKLTEALNKNDLKSAAETVEYWEKEAAALGDNMGLVSVLNEELGLYRRLGDKDKGIKAIEKTEKLLESEGLLDTLSGATVCINLATTLKAFENPDKGLYFYDLAQKVYIENGKTESFEYAALLNNKSSALIDLERFDEAESALERAIEILKAEGNHDGDIALSYLSLAHLTFERDDTAYQRVEEYIDLAWEFINSKRQKRDADWAFAISKCVPSLKYFKRELEAEVLEELAEEIWGNRL